MARKKAADKKVEKIRRKKAPSKTVAKKSEGKKAPAPKPEAPPTDAAAPVSKTQAVKTYLAKHPQAGPTEIVAALKAQGIEITPNYASLIKSKGKRRRRTKVGAAEPTTTTGSTSGTRDEFSIELLVKAKQAAQALGGVDVARAALAALARLFG